MTSSYSDSYYANYNPLAPMAPILGPVVTPALPFLRKALINVLGGTPNETLTPDADAKPGEVPNVIQGGNSRGTTGLPTMGPDAPPPRQPPLADATSVLVDKITDPNLRKKLLEIEYEQIKKRDADIARYRLEGQQEVTRRQAQNNVINAWKDVEVATIQKERDMALGLAEIAYRSSMPNPAVMQQLNAAAQVGVSAFGNKPLPVQ